MKALTIFQPWASLIIAGAKPYEFRKWNYNERFPGLVGQRIAIHAAARDVREDEVVDAIERVHEGWSALVPDIALPILQAALDAIRAAAPLRAEYRRADREYRRAINRVRMVGDPVPVPPELPPSGQIMLRSAVLGTAVIGRPIKAAELFKGRPANDSDRLDHSIFAWPLTEIQPLEEPAPWRGLQGFWDWTPESA